MNCREQQEIIQEYLDDGGNDRMQESLFGHIAGCMECRAFFDSILRTRSAGRSDSTSCPSALDDAVLSLIPRGKDRFSPPVPSDRRIPRLVLSYSFAALLCAVTFGLGLLLRDEIFPRQNPVRITAGSGSMVPTVIMIYGLPPVDVQGIPVKSVIQQHE
ncbi:MAG TPA: hypothetical protein VMW43_03520 [Bacteroidota bacterium]|nr:hypothetical protein [Bacteroidota bacterium]